MAKTLCVVERCNNDQLGLSCNYKYRVNDWYDFDDLGDFDMTSVVYKDGEFYVNYLNGLITLETLLSWWYHEQKHMGSFTYLRKIKPENIKKVEDRLIELEQKYELSKYRKKQTDIKYQVTTTYKRVGINQFFESCKSFSSGISSSGGSGTTHQHYSNSGGGNREAVSLHNHFPGGDTFYPPYLYSGGCGGTAYPLYPHSGGGGGKAYQPYPHSGGGGGGKAYQPYPNSGGGGGGTAYQPYPNSDGGGGGTAYIPYPNSGGGGTAYPHYPNSGGGGAETAYPYYCNSGEGESVYLHQ